MRHANTHYKFLRQGPAAVADDAVIGAWTRASTFAADIEAGILTETMSWHRPLGEACIPGCRQWNERQWTITAGTSAAAIQAVVDAGLARWSGDDLILSGYDIWAQKGYDASRNNGGKGGRPARTATEPTGSSQDIPQVPSQVRPRFSPLLSSALPPSALPPSSSRSDKAHEVPPVLAGAPPTGSARSLPVTPADRRAERSSTEPAVTSATTKRVPRRFGIKRPSATTSALANPWAKTAALLRSQGPASRR